MNRVLDSLRRFQRAQAAAYRRASEALGISDTDLTALQALIAAPDDEVSMKDLAQDVGVSPAVMTGIADRLEQRGWIRRAPHSADRRSTVVIPTVAAEEQVSRVLGGLDDPLRQLANSLSPSDAETVLRLVGAMESELRGFEPQQVEAG